MKGLAFLFCSVLCVVAFAWVQFMGVTSVLADGVGSLFTLRQVERPFTEQDPVARSVTDNAGVLSVITLSAAGLFLGLAVWSWSRRDDTDE